jgi:hypothetical protein
MTEEGPSSTYRWVSGSPQAAENPPHDAVWRRAIAGEVGGFREGVVEVGLDFELQPARTRIDLDNMTRLAIDGLRDAGVVLRGGANVRTIVATKRAGTNPGLGVALVWRPDPDIANPFGGGLDLDLVADVVPGETWVDKERWRDVVAAAWTRPPVVGPVGVEITTTRTLSLAGILKPVIDGLEPYLGQEPKGAGRLRPRDELVTWLKVMRIDEGPVLRVRVGSAPPARAGRTEPRRPYLPPSDPDYPMDSDVVEALERHEKWGRVFAALEGVKE